MKAKIARAILHWDEPFIANKVWESYDYEFPPNLLCIKIHEEAYYVDHFILPKGDSNITEFYLLTLEKFRNEYIWRPEWIKTWRKRIEKQT